MIPPVLLQILYRLQFRLKLLVTILCTGFLFLTPNARSQTFDVTDLYQPTDLATGWLVHGGDDPADARPDLDDSHWAPFNAETDNLHTLFPQNHPEIIWYRLHVKVAPSHIGMALLETNISSAYEIYLNGARVFHAGQIVPYRKYDSSALITVPIPDSQIATGSLLIALRVHIDKVEWTHASPGYYSSNLVLGQKDVIEEHAWASIFFTHALEWLDYLLNLGILAGGILLYSTQRNRPEYLWLSVWTLAWLVAAAPINLYSLFHTAPVAWFIPSSLILGSAGVYAFARMYFAFVGYRVGWRMQLYLIASCTSACLVNVYSDALGALSLNQRLLAGLPFDLLVGVVVPVIVAIRVRHSIRSEGFLVLPVLFWGLYFLGRDIAQGLTQIPAFHDRASSMVNLIFGMRVGPFYFSNYFVGDILSKLSLALIILIRSNRMSRQQAFLEAEMASAREVQQVILPEAVESVPGFRIESVYEPAREVGGDFYQILPVPGDGLLLVIGDVAGKGLPAAMLVSLLVGAIRTAVQYDQTPAGVLAELNERLIGRTRGGFSTALVARFSPGGAVTIANAGHLSPYLDGREIELNGALPLGIASGAQYETTQIRLEPSNRLTFFSDGVVEAQDKSGQLLGFDRARELSTRSAAAIVEAAKAFGQEDDITVITIERVAATEETRTIELAAPILAPSQ